MTSLWRGMATMAQSAGREVVITRGRGATIWDREGNEYLDATASLWYCNVGHGRSEIADAIARQLERIESFHTFDVYANEPAPRARRADRGHRADARRARVLHAGRRIRRGRLGLQDRAALLVGASDGRRRRSSWRGVTRITA